MRHLIMALMCAAACLTATAKPKNNDNAAPKAEAQCDKPCCQAQQQCPPMHQGCPDGKMPQMQRMPQMPGGQHFRNGFRMEQGTPKKHEIVDMGLIRKLNLDSATVKAVHALKKQKREEMHSMMASMRPAPCPAPEMKKDAPADKKDKKADKGKKADKKKDVKKQDVKKQDNAKEQPECCGTQVDRKAMHEARKTMMKENKKKMDDFRKAYRAELRKLLGDEKYIEYLEKVQDDGNKHPMGRRR